MTEQSANKIYWIASYPCSGNSWLRLYLMYLLEHIGSTAKKGLNVDDLNGMMPWDIHSRLYHEVTGKNVADLSAREICEARQSVHELIVAKGQSNMFVKTHAINSRVNGYKTFNPAMIWGTVCLVRNPLDVAVAYAKRVRIPQEQAVRIMNTPGYVYVSGNRSVVEPYGSWSENYLSWSKSGIDKLLLMRFEDLVADPFQQLDHLRNELDITASYDIVQSVLVQMSELSEEEMARAQLKGNFFETREIGQWRNELAPSLVREIVRGQAVAMHKCGYLTDEVLEVAGFSRDEILTAHTQFLKQAKAIRDSGITLQ